MKPSEHPEQMLKVLVREYNAPRNVSIRHNGIAFTTLAVQTGIAKDYIRKQHISNTEIRYTVGDFPSEMSAALRLLEKEGLVEKRGAGSDTHILPTVEGLCHGRWLLRPWYQKIWDTIKNDVRNIIVTFIVAILVSISTYLIMQALSK